MKTEMEIAHEYEDFKKKYQDKVREFFDEFRKLDDKNKERILNEFNQEIQRAPIDVAKFLAILHCL